MACRASIVAPWRRSRPRVSGPRGCPFCRGMEGETPPAVLSAAPAAGGFRLVEGEAEGWVARAFPNKYPIVSSETRPRGAHYVVVESPRHVRHPHEDVDSFRAGFLVAVKLLERLWGEGWTFVAWFKNAGRAGASIDHVHSQVIALSVKPPCEPPGPGGSEDLAVARLGGAVLQAHPVPAADYHLAVRPLEPAPRPWEEEWDILSRVAELIALATRFYVECLGLEDYNAWLWTPPRGRGGPWWVELAPSRQLGGLERGFQVYSVAVDPVEAAREAAGCLRR